LPSVPYGFLARLRDKLGSKYTQILAIVLLISFVAVLVYFFHAKEHLEWFLRWGYGGVFLVTLISSCTILFPVPGELVVITAAGILSPLWVGIVASIGGTLGEITGYLAGYWGSDVVKGERLKGYERAKRWMKRYGSPTVFVFALTPFPFDIVGIASGSLKFPLWKFLLACWAGRLPRHIAEAYLGYSLFQHFFPWLV
jgi:membrane protein YqaA with SNARE-associated domain